MKYICNAKDTCKREDCYHAKPHEWNPIEGCGNGKCIRLDGVSPEDYKAPTCEEVTE